LDKSKVNGEDRHTRFREKQATSFVLYSVFRLDVIHPNKSRKEKVGRAGFVVPLLVNS